MLSRDTIISKVRSSPVWSSDRAQWRLDLHFCWRCKRRCVRWWGACSCSGKSCRIVRLVPRLVRSCFVCVLRLPRVVTCAEIGECVSLETFCHQPYHIQFTSPYTNVRRGCSRGIRSFLRRAPFCLCSQSIVFRCRSVPSLWCQSVALNMCFPRTEGASVILLIDTVSWIPFRSMVTVSLLASIATHGPSAFSVPLSARRRTAAPRQIVPLPVLCLLTPCRFSKRPGRSVL